MPRLKAPSAKRCIKTQGFHVIVIELDKKSDSTERQTVH